jgi:superfamily I DNA and/or RNA helicase
MISHLIIDEACQATEPSALMPFTWNPRKAIIVGDHQQLPATTFSNNAFKTKFDRSLFERLVDSEV